jgi:hypothetical protein
MPVSVSTPTSDQRQQSLPSRRSVELQTNGRGDFRPMVDNLVHEPKGHF